MVHLSGVTKQFGPRILYRKAQMQINEGEKIGLVGPNGAGKTTIFRLITGEDSPDEGTVSKPDRLKIGYFSQNIAEMGGRTALQEVMSAVGDFGKLQARIKEIEARLADPDLGEDEMTKILEEYGELQSEFDRIGGYSLESRAAEILTGLGIGPEDYNRPTEHFSGGWKMRIALAKILALQPDLLLMDEPTNHLDIESIIWLEEWLRQFPGALVMTSHDRDFMNRLVSKIVEVNHKTLTTYGGDYDFYERERKIRHEQLIASAKRQEDMLAKENEFIARFAARASHAAQVQSRVKKLEKIEIIEVPPEEKEIQFQWPEPPRGGDEVVKFEGLQKTWTTPEGREKLVFKDASALVRRLDRVAVVGINGAGKSTLMKVLTGQTQPTTGKYQIGPSIQLGYFSQSSMDILNPANTLLDELQSHFPHQNVGYLRNLLGAMKFSGEDHDKKISILSGGEKSRVVLATLLANPLNFLVLDEPTNHLDIQSRDVLLDALKSFPGTVMMVSHDRHFLRELTTRVFELHKNSLQVFDGTWDYYVEKRGDIFKREAPKI
ncbi:MAG: ABC-F family ATP-binding cassette domain-containing protein [Bdellovibrionaceae bacterium]|nr:ABC-F family ATP-binding cassette domain-containing protein [Pseudobdellovibrionaceae bacterium]